MALRTAAALTAAGLLCACVGPAPGGEDLAGDPVLADYDWSQPRARCRLPDGLDEISGLDHLANGTLLALADNDSTLWRLDCPSGAVRVLAAPGEPLDGDFEGLARNGSILYLLTSPGVVYRAVLGAGDLAVGPAAPVDVGVGGRCGFEGLAATADGAFYLACKYPREPRPGAILLFRAAPAGSSSLPHALWVDVSRVLTALDLPRLRPSGLTWLPERRRLLVLVGKERLILEVDEDGTLLAWRRLQRRLHRQAEGLARLPGGSLAIADEADGRTATLTLYGLARRGPG